MPIPAGQTGHFMAVKAFALRAGVQKIHMSFEIPGMGSEDDFQRAHRIA